MRSATAGERDAGGENIYSGMFSCIEYSLISVSAVCILLVHNREHNAQLKEWLKGDTFPYSLVIPAGFSDCCCSCSAWEGTLSSG